MTPEQLRELFAAGETLDVEFTSETPKAIVQVQADGTVRCCGRVYNSPSLAASAVTLGRCMAGSAGDTRLHRGDGPN